MNEIRLQGLPNIRLPLCQNLQRYSTNAADIRKLSRYGSKTQVLLLIIFAKKISLTTEKYEKFNVRSAFLNSRNEEDMFSNICQLPVWNWLDFYGPSVFSCSLDCAMTSEWAVAVNSTTSSYVPLTARLHATL